MKYPPERVEEGVREFLIFELKKPVTKVKVKGMNVEVRETVPKRVEKELRKILPPEYKLTIKE